MKCAFEGHFAQICASDNKAVRTMADSIVAASTPSHSSASSVCADARHRLLSWMQMDRQECPCISLSASYLSFASR
jgi:hypothetical protein